MDDIRFALPVDNEPGYRLEELPAFLQSNNRVKVRQAYNGDLVELISQEETLRFPIKYRRDITAACLWMIFHFVRFFAPRSDGPRPNALGWQIILPDGRTWVPGLDGDYKMTYEDGIQPLTCWHVDVLRCRITSLAPLTGEARPRAVVYLIQMENTGEEVFHGRLVLCGPGMVGQPCKVHWDGEKLSYSGQMTLEVTSNAPILAEKPGFMVIAPYQKAQSGGVDTDPQMAWDVELAPGESREVAVGIGLGGSLDEAAGHVQTVLGKKADEWASLTVSYVTSYLGKLAITGGEWWQEFFLNHVYQASTALNIDANGRVIGATIAPDMVQSTVQEADIFHGMQIHNWVNPSLYREFVLFFYHFLAPPPAVPIIHNTQPGVEALIAAEWYYRATDDKQFFVDHPEICTLTESLLDRLLVFKASGHWLFPAEEVSDGHPVTRYDFCSNIRNWQAFKGAARLMREVYHKEDLAADYEDIADKIRQDILSSMTMTGPFGPMFAAGTNLPGTFAFMDGEDNVGTLAPYYGFCDFTDERWRNYCRWSFSEYSQTFDPQTGSQPWYGDPGIGQFWIPITSPWAAARIQSSMTRSEAFEEFRRVEWFADVDTSFYWWPGVNQVRNGSGLIGHSLWMSGGVGTVMLNHYLGINLDVPTRQLIFKPWLPWRRYQWQDVRLGNARFSYEHLRGESAYTSSVKNLNDTTWTVSFGFYIPKDQVCKEIRVNSELYEGQVREKPFYEENYLELDSLELIPGETIKITVSLRGKMA